MRLTYVLNTFLTTDQPILRLSPSDASSFGEWAECLNRLQMHMEMSERPHIAVILTDTGLAAEKLPNPTRKELHNDEGHNEADAR